MPSVIFGVWPLAGITSGTVEPDTARQTIRAAIQSGIDTFDTAYSYGFDGQAEQYLGEILAEYRSDPQSPPLRVIGKVGQRWSADRKRYTDASPNQLTADAEESLRRLRLEKFDCLLLHAIDPKVDLKRSADAIEALRRRGLADSIGISNANREELQQFSSYVNCAAIQCPLNLLQRHSLDSIVPAAAGLGSAVYVYWTLMKGLLAGQISRDHQFDVGDSRPGYEIFQGEKRRRAHDVIDRLWRIAQQHDTTVAKLSIGWAVSQPGVTAALVGAKSPAQICETASATPLSQDLLNHLAGMNL
ncbi:MAG TPA: aldo/keto reductase [Planctomycetaceae bacterium]|nr:aldo/keto reductase [Planctomycetaceae bacterium]